MNPRREKGGKRGCNIMAYSTVPPSPSQCLGSRKLLASHTGLEERDSFSTLQYT